MDEFDANTTPYDETGDSQQPAGPSRRSFLKAAVVGSAAVVAASGAGAATLALTGHHTGLKKYVPFIGGATLSGVTSDACTTGTSDQPDGIKDDQTTFNKQESIYFWAAFHNVPAGTYVIDVSPPITASTLVVYQSSTQSPAVKLYEYAAGTMPFTCHPSSLSDLPKTSATANSVAISFTLTSDSDVLLQIHLQGNNQTKTTQTLVLTATLYNGTESIANKVDSATAPQITING